jgi:dihydroorotase
MYDLVLKGGTVVDPSIGLDEPSDVAVSGGTIARIDRDIPVAEAARTIEVAGRIVTPGLIDLHAHVFDGFTRNGVHPDLGGVHAGVTTIVDAGSAGAATFGGFPRHIIPAATPRSSRSCTSARQGSRPSRTSSRRAA